MKLRQALTIVAIMATSNIAAWWLFRAQKIPTKWIGPSAFGAVTIGSLLVAIVLVVFQNRWRGISQPSESCEAAPDSNPWMAQALLQGLCDQQALSADLFTARQLGVLNTTGNPPYLITAAIEVLPDRLQHMLLPLNDCSARQYTRKLQKIRMTAARAATRRVTYLLRYVMVIGITASLNGFVIAAPLGETTPLPLTVMSWLAAVLLYWGTSRGVRQMMWSAKPQVAELLTAGYCVVVLAMAGLQVKWPDLMPFWFLGFTAVVAGGLWPVCWCVKKQHRETQDHWAAYWNHLRTVVADTRDAGELERHQAMLIALHLWRP